MTSACYWKVAIYSLGSLSLAYVYYGVRVDVLHRLG
ncbi:hypothetical protein SAMN04490186_5191 [Pseudomonas grimontii]|uniref:Uncharacterized protein n=1 Tax=Pseudomonas grimontii TaxID=129847 RepID=A0ABY0TSP1_9PSED|nr:hypothetical protein SAMN04490186_5191 [Pseudomonas grimontii]